MLRALAVAALLLASCKGGARQAPPVAHGPVLVTDAELAEYRQTLLDELAANAARVCERPLKRVSTAGTAAADQRAIVEGTGDIAACRARIVKRAEAADWATVRQEPTPDVATLVADCGPVLARAVTQAISHRDACSAYQVGVRYDESLLPTLNVAAVLALYAKAQAHDGHVELALGTLTDLAQFGGDLARGHVSLLTAAIGLTIQGIAVEPAIALVRERRVDIDTLQTLEGAYRFLVEFPPKLGEALVGENQAMRITYGLRPLDPAWAPSAGWGEPAPALPASATPTGVAAFDAAGMMYATAQVMRANLDEACPEDASPALCGPLLGVLAQVASPVDASALLRDATTKLIDGQHGAPAAVAQARDAARTGLALTLANDQLAAFGSYAGKYAHALSRLVAMRVLIQMQEQVQVTGHCPSAQDLTRPPFVDLVEPPTLGAPLSIVPGPALQAPELAQSSGDVSWELGCP